MKADLSRSTFQPASHYHDVRLQQGRVQLDADFNEYVDIIANRIEMGTRDVIGHCGAPRDGAGFQPAAVVADLPADQQAQAQTLVTAQPLAPGDFLISAGRYYVDGILVENDAVLKFSGQSAGDMPGTTPIAGDGLYLAFLDVWLRHLTHLDDDLLREKALNGPDTATRLKTLWQVKLVRVGNVGAVRDCGGVYPAFNDATAVPTGTLAADVDPTPPTDKPCELPPGGGFRRLENQLYRVEIHRSGNANGTATFKWSRDNGTVVSDWQPVTGEPKKLQLLHPPRDQALGFAKGQWVELTDDSNDLNANPGQLLQVVDVKSDVVELSANIAATIDVTRHPKIRRWDGTSATGVDNVSTGGPHTLEDGVRVSFSAGSYRTGDYWLIPARTARADVEWPRTSTGPQFLAPHGIKHHYCRLGFVELAGTALTTSDCRCLFSPLAEPRLDYVGGDGQDVMPDLTLPGQLVRLPEPIEVFVENLQCGDAPLRLRFTVEPAADQVRLLDAAGQTSDAAGVLIVPAGNASDIVRCDWLLSPTVIPPEPPPDVPPAIARRRVTVECIDAAGNPVADPHPLVFTADLSVASKVAYLPPSDCSNLAGKNTAQDAITRLAKLTTIEIVGGDGQDFFAGQRLPKPIDVRVVSKCGAVSGATVAFSVDADATGAKLTRLDGTTDTPLPLKVTLDENGIYSCLWTPDPTLDTQQLTATLVALPGDGVIEQPNFVRFTANPRTADLDPRPVHIIDVQLLKSASQVKYANDVRITFDDFRSGLMLLCDDVIDPATVTDPDPATDLTSRGQPTCFVTVEVPLLATNVLGTDNFQNAVVGYLPIVLDAIVAVDSPPAGAGETNVRSVVVWRPRREAQAMVALFLSRIQERGIRTDALLLRLTLKGNFVWSERAKELIAKGILGGFLDGDSYRAPSAYGLASPSGDGRRGGDFETWFWISVPVAANPNPKLSDVPKDTDVLKLTDVIAKVSDVPPKIFEVTPKLSDVIAKATDVTPKLSDVVKPGDIAKLTDSIVHPTLTRPAAPVAKTRATPKARTGTKKAFIPKAHRPATTRAAKQKKP